MSWLSEVYNELTDPGRPLSKGEIALGREFFGDRIDYSKVRVWFNRHATTFYVGAVGLGWSAMTRKNNITFNSEYHPKAEDVTSEEAQKADYTAVSTLLHELTHIWQHQNFHESLWSREKLLHKHGYDYHKLYAVDVKGPEKFLELNHEQQAEIVTKLAEAERSLKEALANPDYPSSEREIKRLGRYAKHARAKIGDALPLK